MDEKELQKIMRRYLRAAAWATPVTGIPDAARAIAEKLAKGVAWETHKARMMTHKDGHKIVTIDREENISITRLWGRPLSEEDGQLVTMTVRTREESNAEKGCVGTL